MDKASLILSINQMNAGKGEASDSYYVFLPPVVDIIFSEDGTKVIFAHTISPRDLNQSWNIHGGAIATIIDNTTSACAGLHTGFSPYAFASNSVDPKPPQFGVSVDLSCTYVSSAKLGETLMIETTCSKTTKRLAFLTAELYVLRDRTAAPSSLSSASASASVPVSSSTSNQLRVLIATGSHTKYFTDLELRKVAKL